MGLVRRDNGSNGNTGSANVANSGSFQDIRQKISARDNQTNGSNGNRYAWQDRVKPQNDKAREYLKNLNKDKDEDEDKKAKGRRNWNGEDKQEMTDVDRIFHGLQNMGNAFKVSSDNGIAGNVLNATFGSLVSPATAVPSALGNLYEWKTGRPISEAENGEMPDYEMDSNQRAAAFANAAIDIAGVGFGGSKDWLQSAARTGRYAAAKAAGEAGDDIVKKMVSNAVDDIPHGGFDVAKKLGSSALEEGLEEGAQSLISDIQRDQFDDGSLGRAAESAAYGALGGVTMSGAAMGLNRLVGGKGNTPNAGDDPSSTHVSGNPSYDDFTTPASTRGRADADIQDRIEKLQSDDKFVPGSTNYKVVQGRYDIRPDQTVVGTRGLKKMYYESDKSRDYMAKSLGMSVDDADAMFALDDQSLANAINERLNNGSTVEVYLKREPHTSENSYMKFKLSGVMAGNAVMTNTMIPQMNGGDIDGDMMGLLYDKAIAGRARYATASLMGTRLIPIAKGYNGYGKDSRYGKVLADKDYIGFSLDEDIMKNNDWKDADGVDPITKAFRAAFGNIVTSDGRPMYQAAMNSLVNAWNEKFDMRKLVSEPDDYRDASGNMFIDGYAETMLRMGNIRNEIAKILSEKMDATEAYDQADMMMSTLIWNLQRYTGQYVQIKRMVDGGNAKVVDNIVQAVYADRDQSPRMKGDTGRWTRATTVFSHINTIDQLFELAGNTGLRFKQNMYWSATSSRLVDEAVSGLAPRETFQQLVNNMMKVTSYDATPKRQMENLFRAYVSSEVRRRTGMEDARFDRDAVDIESLVETFVEVYDDYVKRYNDAMEQIGVTGSFKPISSKGKSEIMGSKSMARAFLDVFGSYAVDDQGHTLDQVVAQASKGVNGTYFVDLMLSAGKKKNDFFRLLAEVQGTREYNKGKSFENIVNSTQRRFEVSWDENGNAVYSDFDAPYIEMFWEYMKPAIGLDACHAYGLINWKSAISSRFGRDLFGTDPDARMNTILKIRVQYKYRNYARNMAAALDAEEKAESAESDADRKNLETQAADYRKKAVASAKMLYGTSFLDDTIVDEIVRNGSDNYLMNIVGDKLTYAEKKKWFEERQSKLGSISPSSLIENAARTDASELSSSEFSNSITEMRKAADTCGKRTREAARQDADDIISLLKDKGYNGDDVVAALMAQMRSASQQVNIDLMATVLFDAADVVKGHIDKGASTPSEAELYQILAKINDTGAKSAINRITGSSMNASTVREIASSKRDILAALSDPSYSKRVMADDGSGYFNLTRDSVFKAVGVKLNGRNPGIADWITLLDKAPQIVTWMSDTSFAPVPDGDSVTETSNGPVSARIRSLISNDTAFIESKEKNEIRNRILNDPNNARVILGVMGADYPGTQFNDLLESPVAFRDAFERALNRIVDYEHYTLGRSDDAKMVGPRFEGAAREYVKNQTQQLYASAMLLANSMQVNIDRVNELMALGITRGLASNVYQKSMLEELRRKNALPKDLESQIFEDVGSNTDAAVRTWQQSSDSETQLAFILMQVTGMNIDNVTQYDPKGTPGYDNFKRHLLSANVEQDAIDAAEIECDKNGIQIVDLPDFAKGKIILMDDMRPENIERMARKIYEIKTSGDYSVVAEAGDDTYNKILDDLTAMIASNDRAAIEREKNRFNGLIVARAIDNAAGANRMNYNRRYYSATVDTMNQFNKMTISLKSAKDNREINVSSTREVMMPKIDFRNRSLGVLSDFAVSSLEGSGNSLMSGIEGGEYQQLISIAGLNGDVDFNIPPRLMSLREIGRMYRERPEIANQCRFIKNVYVERSKAASSRPPQVTRENIGVLSYQKMRELEQNTFVNLYQVDNEHPDGVMVWVYPMDDSPIPDVMHMRLSSNRAPGKRYNALTRMLVDMVYDRSEPGVFKRKKDIGKFDSIVRRMTVDRESGYAILPRPTIDPKNPDSYRQGIVSSFMNARRTIADKYFQEFALEKMDSQFGKTDALMLAQITTPAIEITFTDGSKRSVSSISLWSQSEFAKLVPDPSTITEIRILQVPLSTVCSRVGGYITGKLADRIGSETDEDRVTAADLTEATVEGFKSFDNFSDLGTNGVSDFISMIAPLSRSHRSNIPIARSPLPPAKFMNADDGMGRGVANLGGNKAWAKSAHLDKEWERAVNSLNIDIEGDYAGSKIAFTDIDSDASDKVMRPKDLSPLTDPQLHQSVQFVQINGNKPAMVAIKNDSRDYEKIYKNVANMAKETGTAPAIMLFPTSDILGLYIDDRAVAGTTEIAGTEFTILDVDRIPSYDTYLGPVPDFFPVTDEEIEFMIANYTMSDSSTLFNPADSNKRVHMSEIAGLSKDVIFPGPSFRGSVIEMPDGPSDLAEFRKAFEGRNSDDKSKIRFVYPKFPAGNQAMDKREIDAMVSRYLNVADQYADNDGNPCFIDTDVQLGSCIGFVKTFDPRAGSLSGDYVYAPVIINKGGVPANIDRIVCGVDPKNADELQFVIEGYLSASTIDGLKMTFPNAAFKTYGRMADQDEWDMIGISLAADIGTEGNRFHINGFYSGNTEDGRLIGRGSQTLAETLYFGHLAMKGGIFWKVDQDGKPFLDYDEAMRITGLSKADIDELMSINHYSRIWDRVIAGEIDLSTDSEVNMAIREVAMAVKNANSAIGKKGPDMSPAAVLSTYSMQGGKPAVVMTATANIDYLLGGIDSYHRLLKLFHYINPMLCPDGYNDTTDAGYLVNKNGEIRVKDKDGRPYYATGHIMMSRLKHDSSQLGIASRHAAFGNQQFINSILDRGFSGYNDVNKALQLIAISNGDYTPYLINGRYFKDRDARDVEKFDDTFTYDNVDASIMAAGSLEYNYDEKVTKKGQETYYRYLTVIDNKHDRNVVDPNDNRLSAIYGRFNKAFGFDTRTDPLIAHAVFKMATGYSYNDGDGSDTVTIDQLESGLSLIESNLKKGDGYFIRGGIYNNRYTLPLGPRPIMEYLWNHSSTLKSMAKEKGITFDQWVESAATEMDVSKDAVGSIRQNRKAGRAKQRALSTIMEFCYRSHGMGYRGPSISGFYDIHDKIASMDPMFRNLESVDDDLVGMRERQENEFKDHVSQWKMGRDLDKFNKIDAPYAPNGFVASWFGLHNSYWQATANTLINASRTMALISGPMLPASAFVSRAKGYGMSRAMLFFRTKGDYVIKDQQGLKNACKSTDVREIWDAFNEIQMNTPEMDALLSIAENGGDYDAMRQYMLDYHERQGKLGKFSRKVSKIATADGALTSWQINLFVNEFAQSLPDDSAWLAKDADGRTLLENRVLADPAGFLVEVMGTNHNTYGDFVAARRARDVAMSGDFAQRTSYGLILNEIFKKHPIGEFLVATGFLKFPNYMINSSGFFMQHIAPVSALYHWTTSMLVKKAKSENPMFLGVDLSSMELESTLRYKSFKEAFHADVVNLGMSAVAAILLNVLNFEPPKDEEGNPDPRYMGNLNEWTIMGIRVDEPWWLQDIAGPALALAAFTKSCSIGQPRLDLIGNWMSQAMWNNPILRASDVLSVVFPTDEDDYMIEEGDLYADSKGGEPSLMQMLQTGFLTYGMNFASQFITPSIVKELYRTMPEYESSYKRVYVTDENGNVVTDENGMPYTVVTDYADQQKRRLARSNPFAALVFNIFNQGETGYSTLGFMNSMFGLQDMPLTVYYQQDELACVQYYSLYTTDENGVQVAKSPEEMNSIAYDVISVLEVEDDMTELRASGWVLPYDTRAYVSKLLWDQIHYLDSAWSNWVEEEAYDFTVLGGGDFGYGRQLYEQAKQAYNDDRRHLMDIYNKLWDDALSTGITQYNRYNTTYQQDSYGNWYATGFRKGMLWNAAPGTTTDPGPTLGVTGSWETPAYANPEISAGGRALVPIDTVYTDTPAISTWSEDGNGEGYSDMVALTMGALADNETGPNNKSGRPSYRSYYSRSYGGYRRGGGGGGGGGGYSPNLYSRLPSVNMPYASNMYAERLYDANYDYLRPNFETKGSREAYKRSDI